MRLRVAVLTIALLGSTACQAAAAEPHLGTPEVITSFSGESNLIGSSSSEGHPDAYAVFHRVIGRNIYSVVHRDSRGHGHRFDIRNPGSSYPQAIELVGLEAGGGMAIWDDASTGRVLARHWTAGGELGATRVVLSQVATLDGAGFGTARWRARGDGRGTVVVATTGLGPTDAARVYASVRDPGGEFSARQELTRAGSPPAGRLDISPIAADGTVAVAWGPEYEDGTGARVTRAGRAASFGAPAAAPYVAPVGLTRANQTILADDGSPITISVRLARNCPCLRPHVFIWPTGARVLAFSVLNGDWYVAAAGAGGVFYHSVRATTNEASLPVRRARPGEIGFARFDTNTDHGLFRQRSRLVVVPFGTRVARSRRAPRLAFGTFARLNRARHLLIPVYCDRACGMHGSSGRAGRLPITDARGTRIDASLEPFTVAYLRVRVPAGRTKVRVSAGAADDAGHRSNARATFVRGQRSGLWCLSQAPGCGG